MHVFWNIDQLSHGSWLRLVAITGVIFTPEMYFNNPIVRILCFVLYYKSYCIWSVAWAADFSLKIVPVCDQFGWFLRYDQTQVVY